MFHDSERREPLRVVLFSGGRGSGALTTTLVRTPGVDLTIAINGYDDGASTGEVRRFLGDALGPSDFRKNASRLALELGTCHPALVRLLDRRLPERADRDSVRRLIDALGNSPDGADPDVRALAAAVGSEVCSRLARFADELDASGRPFDFADCSVGNLVFAGDYLLAGRRFNEAVDRYASLVGLPAGLVENVTDGTHAVLVALDADGRILGREAEIVDANRRNRIRDIFLVDRMLGPAECEQLAAGGAEHAAARLAALSVTPGLNPRLQSRIAAADLIVYAPGTQHSSLFPSYLTPGLSGAIAANLRAVKLLITNIQADAEISGSSAVDLIDRAVYYLKEKGRHQTPTSALITHYLINEPGRDGDASSPYVPLGRLDALHDPRLVRVGHYEEARSGRHDAVRVLEPFIASALGRRVARPPLAVVLYGAGSVEKLAQTLVEMVRGGIEEVSNPVTVFCETDAAFEPAFTASLPFELREVPPLADGGDAILREGLQRGGFEYVLLFESSGMYDGEDVPWLASHLTGRLDAVWGSRRLSVRDIEESYRLTYRRHAVLGAVSRAGSHALSLLYLLLHGRYVSDTLSGARAVRVGDVLALAVTPGDYRANQQLLTGLLRRKAEMFEVPVHFYPLSPEQVRRTTVLEGLRAIAAIVWGRMRPASPGGSAVQVGTAHESAGAVPRGR